MNGWRLRSRSATRARNGRGSRSTRVRRNFSFIAVSPVEIETRLYCRCGGLHCLHVRSVDRSVTGTAYNWAGNKRTSVLDQISPGADGCVRTDVACGTVQHCFRGMCCAIPTSMQALSLSGSSIPDTRRHLAPAVNSPCVCRTSPVKECHPCHRVPSYSSAQLFRG